MSDSPASTGKPGRFSDAASLTPEAIAKVRARLGIEKDLTYGWNTEVTRDGIRHWTDGLGDDNPLWSSDDYAAGSAWGEVIPPPSFYLTAVQGPRWRGSKEPSKGGGLPGLHAVWTEEEWEWLVPGRLGDRLKVFQTFIADVKEKESGFGGHLLETVTEDRVMAREKTVAIQIGRASCRERV